MRTVYVSIGNSDNKLTQQEWSDFWHEMNNWIQGRVAVHGAWLSEPSSRYQNACWCFEVPDDPNSFVTQAMISNLIRIARDHRQDSVTWMLGDVQFLKTEC